MIAVGANDSAAALKQTRITRAIGDVKLVGSEPSPRRAVLREEVPGGAVVQTGPGALAEFVLADDMLIRLGGKTTFALANSGHVAALNDGAILFEATAGNGAKIQVGGITLDVQGSTGIIERQGSAYVKFMILAGTARVSVATFGESVLVGPGQLLIMKPGAKMLPEPADFALEPLYRTSVLTSSAFAPLAFASRIQREIARQQSDPEFARTNLVIHGRGTVVEIAAPNAAAAAKPTASRDKPDPKR